MPQTGSRAMALLLAATGLRRDPYAPHHARLEMAGEEARIMEFPGVGELPDQGPRLARADVHHARLGMMHAGMLLHHFGVLLQLVHRAEHHFLHHLAGILQAEAHWSRPASPAAAPERNAWHRSCRGRWCVTPSSDRPSR